VSTETPGRKCPGCESTNLRYGSLTPGTACFRPSDSTWLSLNYPVAAFVCLDCGFLGQYLDNAQLQRLRGKTA
jgi:hypothetical protein